MHFSQGVNYLDTLLNFALILSKFPLVRNLMDNMSLIQMDHRYVFTVDKLPAPAHPSFLFVCNLVNHIAIVDK